MRLWQDHPILLRGRTPSNWLKVAADISRIFSRRSLLKEQSLNLLPSSRQSVLGPCSHVIVYQNAPHLSMIVNNNLHSDYMKLHPRCGPHRHHSAWISPFTAQNLVSTNDALILYSHLNLIFTSISTPHPTLRVTSFIPRSGESKHVERELSHRVTITSYRAGPQTLVYITNL